MADYNVDFMDERFPEKWIAAMRDSVRRDRVSVVLSRGSEKQDKDIIESSLYINRKVMGGKFDIGTCCTAEMGVTFTDDNAIDTNYGGVLATVVYSLCVDEEADEWYFSTAGPFIIDGQKSKRSGDRVKVKAYDVLSNFDYDMPKYGIPKFANLYAAVDWICDSVPLVNGIRFGAMPESEFNKLPNAEIVPDFSSAQIVSYRDALMWIAQATGTCIFYGRQGITFKQYRYTGNMSNDREVIAEERESIEFTDTRTYCAYLSASCSGTPKIYSNIIQWDESWEPKYIKTGGLNIPENPILSALSSSEQDTVNNNILANMSYPTRYVKMSGSVDFLLEPLDCVAFTGGNIDIRNMIIAPATEINWKYRGTGKIVCANVEEYTDTLPSEAAVLAAEGIAARANTAPTIHTPVYPQSEKAIQGVKPKTDSIVTPNGASLTIRDFTESSRANWVDLIIKNKNGAQLCDIVIRSDGGFNIRTFDENFDSSQFNKWLQWVIDADRGVEDPKLSVRHSSSGVGFKFSKNVFDNGTLDVCLGRNPNNPSRKIGVRIYVDPDTGELETVPYTLGN